MFPQLCRLRVALKDVRPLLTQIVETVLPQIARATLGPRVLELIEAEMVAGSQGHTSPCTCLSSTSQWRHRCSWLGTRCLPTSTRLEWRSLHTRTLQMRPCTVASQLVADSWVAMAAVWVLLIALAPLIGFIIWFIGGPRTVKTEAK